MNTHGFLFPPNPTPVFKGGKEVSKKFENGTNFEKSV